MKKSNRFLASVLALSLCGAVLLGGCGQNGNNNSSQSQSSQGSGSPDSVKTEADKSSAEESTEANPSADMTLYVMTGNDKEDFLEMTNVQTVNDWYPGTIEWIQMVGDQGSLMMNTGDYGDILLGSNVGLNDSSLSEWVAGGILIPLDDYINEDITPNLMKMFEQFPSTKAVSTFVDGHIYALPAFREDVSDYLEDVIFINKTWLDKLNLEVPTTTDELYDVLVAFRDGDPNGNGQADEIPLTFGKGSSGFSFMEEFLGSFGLPTKYLPADGFRSVKDGEVVFAPATDEWKEMMIFFRKLYQEKLINEDVFIATNDETFNALTHSDPSIVGVFWNKVKDVSNPDDYIAILPPAAPGREVKWRMHPGSVGIKNKAAITDHCEDIEGAMRWLDNFYDVENTIVQWYGPVGETFEVRNGMYCLVDEDQKDGFTGDGTINGDGLPGFLPMSAYGTLMEPLDFIVDKQEFYKMYQPILAGGDEIWPRPFLTADQSAICSEIWTDLKSYVDEKEVRFITDPAADVEAEWDGYLKDLENLRLPEYLENSQEAYDAYYNSYMEMQGM